MQWTVESVRTFVQSLLVLAWSYAGLKFIVSHIAINVVFAVVTAARTGTFDSTKLADFLFKKVLPYSAAYLIVKLFGQDAGLDYLAAPVWAVLEYTLLGNLTDNLQKLGLPVPDRVMALFRQSGA